MFNNTLIECMIYELLIQSIFITIFLWIKAKTFVNAATTYQR